MENSAMSYCRCFEPPTSKFVSVRLTPMVRSEDTRIILVRAERPHVQLEAACVTGAWFVVWVTNGQEMEKVSSLLVKRSNGVESC